MIFVDTGAFIARYVERDRYHRPAVIFWSQLAASKEPLVTSNFVIDETLTLLARRAGYQFASERAYRIYESRALSVLRPGKDEELAALTWFEKYADQAVSFTDCVSFVLMRRHKIRRAFAFDQHFNFAGFQLFPTGY